MTETTYICAACGATAAVKSSEPVPVCCGAEMRPLPVCEMPVSAESSRSGNEDGPCADGTTPKKR